MQRRGESGQSVKGKRAPGPKARKAPTVHASSPDLQAELDRRTRERDEAPRAAGRDIRGTASHQSIYIRFANGAGHAGRIGRSAVRGGDSKHLAAKGRCLSSSRQLRITSRYKEYLENKKYLETVAIEPGRGTIVGRTLFEGKTVHVHDVQSDPEYNLSGVIALGGYRSHPWCSPASRRKPDWRAVSVAAPGSSHSLNDKLTWSILLPTRR